MASPSILLAYGDILSHQGRPAYCLALTGRRDEKGSVYEIRGRDAEPPFRCKPSWDDLPVKITLRGAHEAIEQFTEWIDGIARSRRLLADTGRRSPVNQILKRLEGYRSKGDGAIAYFLEVTEHYGGMGLHGTSIFSRELDDALDEWLSFKAQELSRPRVRRLEMQELAPETSPNEIPENPSASCG